MTKPDVTEQRLQQQYQQAKMQHRLPRRVKRQILASVANERKGAAKQNGSWPTWWRSGQFALSIAALAFLAYLMQIEPSTPYYQIVVTTDSQFKQIEQHSLTSKPGPAVVAQLTPGIKTAADEQYQLVQQNSAKFYARTGLLRQQQQDWQISICDELLVNIDNTVMEQLQLNTGQLQRMARQQWVEFVSNSSGQIVAINPASAPLQCAGS